MKVKRIFAPNMQKALREVRELMGPEAIILSNQRVRGGVEIVCGLSQPETAVEPPASLPEAKEPSYLEQELAKEQRQLRARAQAVSQSVAQRYSKERYDEETLEQGALTDFLARLKKKQDRGELELSEDMAQQLSQSVSSSQASSAGRRARPAQVDKGGSQLDFLAQEPPPERSPEAAQVIDDMRNEINGLRDLLEKQLADLQAAQPKPRSKLQNQLAARLRGLGFGRKLANQWVESVEPQGDKAQAWKQLIEAMQQALPVFRHEAIKHCAVINLVGPTGAGKTTSIGKLATRFALYNSSRSIALVTTDNDCIAAHEQLHTYGRILDVPVKIVPENASLADTLDQLSDYDLVLVDSPGLNPANTHHQRKLKEMRELSLRMQSFLVLDSTCQQQYLLNSYERYKSLHLAGCLLTKVDQATSLGESLGVALEKRLPIAYLGNGQNIAEDISLAQPETLLKLCIELAKGSIDNEPDHPLSEAYPQAPKGPARASASRI